MAEGRASATLVGLQRLPPSLSGRPRDLLVVCGRLGSFKDCAGRQGSLAGFQGDSLPSQPGGRDDWDSFDSDSTEGIYSISRMA